MLQGVKNNRDMLYLCLSEGTALFIVAWSKSQKSAEFIVETIQIVHNDFEKALQAGCSRRKAIELAFSDKKLKDEFPTIVNKAIKKSQKKLDRLRL